MRQVARRIRTKTEAGDAVFGVIVQLPSPESVEMAGYTGYDFVWIDAEHGTLTLTDINNMIRAAEAVGVDAIVRVPDNNPSFIQRVLDAGATGIMVPHIRTVEEAKGVVAAAKFFPEGTRGSCPSTRAVGHVTDNWVTDYRLSNSDVLVIGLIEDVEGVDNAEAIAAESGLDALMCGPFDLSMSLGLEGDIAHPQVRELQARVAAAVKSAGIQYVAIQGWEGRDTATLLADGVQMFNVVSDRSALYSTFSTSLARVKDSIDEARKDTAA